MIKFLGHIMDTIDGKLYYDNEEISDVDDFEDELHTFAPREAGDSCLMIGENKPNYGTYLEQKQFLDDVYFLMITDIPELFYEYVKKHIDDRSVISTCQKYLEEKNELRQSVISYFLEDLKNCIEYGIDIVSYCNLCDNNKFNIQVIENFFKEINKVDDKKNKINRKSKCLM